MSDEVEKTIKEMIANNPKWLIENEDGTFSIKHKDTTYILKEQSGEVMETCTRLSEKSNTPIEALLARRCVQSPELTDDTYKKLPGSIYSKIKLATIFIHGLNDF